ncbi:MAG TPA: LamG-like jellyroll fold domain-containing protein, partial [Candidatus Eisenbacteria bacterium]|nr:LamG-like jellyroll fold domain-containing protein [Candidatus Eisenbacteria bacterium]
MKALGLILTLLFALAGSAFAQRHVLELDGKTGYVELPPNIFNDLDEATVEAWVKWRSFSSIGARFFSYGEMYHDTGIQADADGTLYFFISEGQGQVGNPGLPRKGVVGAVRTNEWYHIAAVSGREGMKLYLDGGLLGTNSFTGGFGVIKGGPRARLGRSVVNDEPLTDGQLAEVRVWKVARTEAQIRQTMFQRLIGNEPGLAGLWNFDKVENGFVRDATPALHHSKLIGAAQIVQADFPGAAGVRSSKVLELDGNGSFVELPADAFTNLTEVTVEGWVKWESFKPMSRFFDFTFSAFELDVQNRGASPTLWMGKTTGISNAAQWDSVQVPEFLSAGRWIHVAAVSGADGIRLFADGTLVSTNVTRDATDNRRTERRNYLGRSNWRVAFTNDADCHGQMDELRVWKVARTEAQVRQNMFKQLTGNEPDLVGLWNFEDGTANDSSSGAHHGTFVGSAKIAVASLPSAVELVPWSRLTGKATDAAGTAIGGAIIRAEANGTELARATSSQSGDYILTLRTSAESVDLTASAPKDLVASRSAIAISPYVQSSADLILKPALHIGGKVVALDGKTPHGQLVVELVRPAGAEMELSSNPARLSSVRSSTGNRVLRLASTNSYVELPPRVFEHLGEATIEAWVKWEQILGLSAFYSYGEINLDTGVGTWFDTSDLCFFLRDSNKGLHR